MVIHNLRPTILFEIGHPEVGRVGRLDQVTSFMVIQDSQQVLLTCRLHLLGDLRVKGHKQINNILMNP